MSDVKLFTAIYIPETPFDVYVTGKGFNWTNVRTHVRTHETGWCGPYFSRKNNTI